jgi:hypothetical protein
MIIGKHNLQQCSSIFTFFISLTSRTSVGQIFYRTPQPSVTVTTFFYYIKGHREQKADNKLLL